MKTFYPYLVVIFLFLVSCAEDETILEKPELLTNERIEVYANSAIVKGEISRLGDYNIIDHGFVLSKETNPTISDIKITLGSIDKLGYFQDTIENLDQNTNYFVRSYLIYDNDKVLYSNELTFNTLESNVWTEKTNYLGGYLVGAVSFVVDDELFVGTGVNDNYVNYFYKYDHNFNSWEAVASLPSSQRAHGIAFSIGNYGYVGLGEYFDHYNNKDYYYNDLWRYNPMTNSWTKMSDFPGKPRAYSTCFVIDDKAYITDSQHGDKDLWEYNTLTDSWTKKSDYPGNSIGFSFSINDKGYVGFGMPNGIYNDFWEYDPMTDAWIEKENFPGKSRSLAVSFSFMNKGYLACGINKDNNQNSNFLTDIWEYNQNNDTWTKIDTNYPGKGRMDMIVGVIGNKIFIGLGADSNFGSPSTRCEDIWEYIPDLN